MLHKIKVDVDDHCPLSCMADVDKTGTQEELTALLAKHNPPEEHSKYGCLCEIIEAEVCKGCNWRYYDWQSISRDNTCSHNYRDSYSGYSNKLTWRNLHEERPAWCPRNIFPDWLEYTPHYYLR